ncbi:hypothetical protein KAU15_05465, partial [candidate division WOR-3 bacterium]|nr:hypothetical protein [candidate division WOR-3 bacterium]
MKRFVFLLIILLSIIVISKQLEIDKIILSGKGQCIINSNRIVSASAIYDVESSMIDSLLGENLKHTVRSDEYILLCDHNNNIDILKIESGNINHLASINISYDINNIIFAYPLIFIETFSKTMIYDITGDIVSEIINRRDFNINNAVNIISRYIVLAENGRELLHCIINSDSLIINDTLNVNITDALFKSNYKFACAVSDSFVDCYQTNDTTLNLVFTFNVKRPIKDVFEIDSNFIFISKDSIFIYENPMVYEFNCIDSISFNENIKDVNIINDSMYILTDYNLYKTTGKYSLNIIDTTKVAYNLKGIMHRENDFIIWADSSFYTYDPITDSFNLLLANIYGKNIIDEKIINKDSSIYLVLNDTLKRVNVSAIPVSIYEDNNKLYYSDNKYNVYYSDIDSIDSLIFKSGYPIFDILKVDNDYLFANGYYGYNLMNGTGNIIYSYFSGDEAFNVNSVKAGYLLSTINNILLVDTLFNIISTNENRYISDFKTDTSLLIVSNGSILECNDSIVSIYNSYDYFDFTHISMNSVCGVLILKSNILLKVNYVSSGFPMYRS